MHRWPLFLTDVVSLRTRVAEHLPAWLVDDLDGPSFVVHTPAGDRIRIELEGIGPAMLDVKLVRLYTAAPLTGGKWGYDLAISRVEASRGEEHTLQRIADAIIAFAQWLDGRRGHKGNLAEAP